MNSSSHQHSWGSQAFTHQRSHPSWEESQPSHSALNYGQDGPLTQSMNPYSCMYFVVADSVECWNFFGNVDFHKTLSWVGNGLSQWFAYVSERQPREARSSPAYFSARIKDRSPTIRCTGGQTPPRSCMALCPTAPTETPLCVDGCQILLTQETKTGNILCHHKAHKWRFVCHNLTTKGNHA